MESIQSKLESSALARFLKRLLDVIVSLAGLIAVAFFVPFVWLAQRRESPGSVFFKQERKGKNGVIFKCYKFRSMHVNSVAEVQQATENDERKFPFGDFMRRRNIDELPQFINVLKGEMSIVGPRPHMLYHEQIFQNTVKDYALRRLVKPGMTGWAQITGYRGETKCIKDIEKRVEKDLWYIKHWSLLLDLRIILITAKEFLWRDKKAY